LFLLALQVLARFTEGIETSPTVRKRLAGSLPDELRSLPTDELATAVIRSQLESKVDGA
jgi:hypothetical protein